MIELTKLNVEGNTERKDKGVKDHFHFNLKEPIDRKTRGKYVGVNTKPQYI